MDLFDPLPAQVQYQCPVNGCSVGSKLLTQHDINVHFGAFHPGYRVTIHPSSLQYGAQNQAPFVRQEMARQQVIQLHGQQRVQQQAGCNGQQQVFQQMQPHVLNQQQNEKQGSFVGQQTMAQKIKLLEQEPTRHQAYAWSQQQAENLLPQQAWAQVPPRPENLKRPALQQTSSQRIQQANLLTHYASNNPSQLKPTSNQPLHQINTSVARAQQIQDNHSQKPPRSAKTPSVSQTHAVITSLGTVNSYSPTPSSDNPTEFTYGSFTPLQSPRTGSQPTQSINHTPNALNTPIQVAPIQWPPKFISILRSIMIKHKLFANPTLDPNGERKMNYVLADLKVDLKPFFQSPSNAIDPRLLSNQCSIMVKQIRAQMLMEGHVLRTPEGFVLSAPSHNSLLSPPVEHLKMVKRPLKSEAARIWKMLDAEEQSQLFWDQIRTAKNPSQLITECVQYHTNISGIKTKESPVSHHGHSLMVKEIHREKPPSLSAQELLPSTEMHPIGPQEGAIEPNSEIPKAKMKNNTSSTQLNCAGTEAANSKLIGHGPVLERAGMNPLETPSPEEQRKQESARAEPTTPTKAPISDLRANIDRLVREKKKERKRELEMEAEERHAKRIKDG